MLRLLRAFVSDVSLLDLGTLKLRGGRSLVNLCKHMFVLREETPTVAAES